MTHNQLKEIPAPDFDAVTSHRRNARQCLLLRFCEVPWELLTQALNGRLGSVSWIDLHLYEAILFGNGLNVTEIKTLRVLEPELGEDCRASLRGSNFPASRLVKPPVSSHAIEIAVVSRKDDLTRCLYAASRAPFCSSRVTAVGARAAS